VTSFRPFRKKRSYTLPVLIILLALGLTYFSGPVLQGARVGLQAVIYPFQYTADAVWRFTVGLPGGILALRQQAAEIVKLKEQLAGQAARLTILEELKLENARLRGDLSFRSRGYAERLLAAAVVARSGSPWPGLIEIDRGASHGVKVNMPVVAQTGLVGRVSEVAPFSAKVLLVSDPLSAVSAVVQRSRVLGVIAGYSPELLEMKYLGTGSDVRAGDAIVTSAISSLFPAGLPVGTVTSAAKADVDLFYQVKVRPAVNFSALEEVFVVL
jgi:rod shape-determining protein MreC